MKQLKVNKINRIKTDKPVRQQSGFSLIELLIATTLGVFLMGGVVTNFVGTKDSDRMRRAVSEMDENARVAMEVLRKSISHAGYPSINNTHFDDPFYTRYNRTDVVENKSCSNGSKRYDGGTIPHRFHYTRDSYWGDYISVGFLADNPCKDGLTSCPDPKDVNPDALMYTDCTGGGITRKAVTVNCSTDPDVGMPEANDARIYSTFYLGRDGRYDRNDRYKMSLMCRGTRGGTQSIVNNVQYMQILYGITQDDGTTRYLSANRVTSASWPLVTSVQIGLLMRSSEKNILKEDGVSRRVLLDRTVSIRAGERRRLYREYTTTISLLNRNQGVIR